MKKLTFAPGGRPLANDDLSTLQQELLAAAQALYADAPPCIITGCRLSGTTNGAYSVGPGLLWLDGQLLRFAGQSAVTLPAQFTAGPDTPDPAQVRPYQSGASLPCMSEVPAVLVPAPATAAGEILLLYSWGALRWSDVQRAAVRRPSEVQQLANLVSTEYDSSGKGNPGTAAWGWALCNGSNGTADLRQMFVAGYDPGFAEYNVIGNPGTGKDSVVLELANIPEHSHTTNASVYGGTTSYSTGTSGNSSPNNSTARAATVQPAGGLGGGFTRPHENRPPFYVLALCQWIGL